MSLNLKFHIIAACLVAAFLTTNAQTHSSEIGLQSDNDSYLLQGSDRYYTDGIFLFYRHALKTSSNAALQNKVLGFELGQKIYNPQTGNIPSANTVDRPFAGYLYAGASLNLLYKNESNLKLGAQIGMIGPAAGGEGAQKFVHNTFGFYSLNGWMYQIKNAFQLNLSAEYNRLLARSDGFDVSASGYANLGTGFTGAGVGPLFRLGKLGQLFNSISTQSTAIAKENAPQTNNGEFFVHYKPQFNYVAYDATIEGGLFNKKETGSLEVTRVPVRAIFSNQVGVSFVSKRWVIDYTATFPTSVVKPQHYSQQWASITLLYRFN
ncbi:lipid A deacylase LpxR family protein [Mucilaginibacter calamicampi]|uniref:Lipid A deacylase LpxR family protein n=1 Tax=Mucilaginibacter calamicampi TaxID=1302352 RepID=A0ABW2YU82_9SPHI